MRLIVLCCGLMSLGVTACSSVTQQSTVRIQQPDLTQIGKRNQGYQAPAAAVRGGASKLLAAANNLKGKSVYWASGQRYPHDCSGFVQASLLKAGFDLQAYLPQARAHEGAVARLYRMAYKYRMLHKKSRPKAGDLVFFDNTWDRNQNGRLDDPLTHVGIVISSEPDGTVTFIHRVSQGVKLYKLNRRRHERRDPKTNKVLNSFLRRRGYAGERLRLSGELFRAYATVFGKNPIVSGSYPRKPKSLKKAAR